MGPIIAFSSFALAALTAAPEVPSDVSLGWVLPNRAVYAGETVPVALEITVPEPWLGENLLQLFPQPLDLPLQVSGFEGLGGTRLRPAQARQPAGTSSVVLDGAICHAHGPMVSEGPDGRVATFTIRRWFTAPRAGRIELPGAGAHYAYAAEFRDDFVQGRVPVDRRTADAIGDASSFDVLPLPESGRPLEFTGVVGAYELSSQRTLSSVQLGESVTMEVRVESIGGLPAPALEARDVRVAESDQFVEQGRTLTKGDGETTVDISFAARSTGFHELPDATLTLFDPTLSPPAFRTAWAQGPGVQVRGKNAVPTPTPEPASGGAAVDQPTGNDPPKPTPYWTMAVGGFIFALAVASVIRRRIL